MTTKKRKLFCLLSITVVILLLPGCINFSAPKYSEEKIITTLYGDTFVITRQESDFPDQEISIGVSKEKSDSTFHFMGEESSTFFYGGFSNYLSFYDYETDFLNKWYDIIKCYKNKDIKAYQFNWGVIYSIDDGTNYTCILKQDYEVSLASNNVFKNIYDHMS